LKTKGYLEHLDLGEGDGKKNVLVKTIGELRQITASERAWATASDTAKILSIYPARVYQLIYRGKLSTRRFKKNESDRIGITLIPLNSALGYASTTIRVKDHGYVETTVKKILKKVSGTTESKVRTILTFLHTIVDEQPEGLERLSAALSRSLKDSSKREDKEGANHEPQKSTKKKKAEVGVDLQQPLTMDRTASLTALGKSTLGDTAYQGKRPGSWAVLSEHLKSQLYPVDGMESECYVKIDSGEWVKRHCGDAGPEVDLTEDGIWQTLSEDEKDDLFEDLKRHLNHLRRHPDKATITQIATQEMLGNRYHTGNIAYFENGVLISRHQTLEEFEEETYRGKIYQISKSGHFYYLFNGRWVKVTLKDVKEEEKRLRLRRGSTRTFPLSRAAVCQQFSQVVWKEVSELWGKAVIV
jgi:hypothetical protein